MVVREINGGRLSCFGSSDVRGRESAHGAKSNEIKSPRPLCDCNGCFRSATVGVIDPQGDVDEPPDGPSLQIGLVSTRLHLLSSTPETMEFGIICTGRDFLSPPLPFTPHVILDGSPKAFNGLAVPPSPSFPSLRIHICTMCFLVPAFEEEGLDRRAPAFDFARGILTPLSNVDTEKVPKELLWFTPLVASKLPHLSCGKDSHDTVPVVGLELFRTVNDDEPVWASTGVKGS